MFELEKKTVTDISQDKFKLEEDSAAKGSQTALLVRINWLTNNASLKFVFIGFRERRPHSCIVWLHRYIVSQPI